MLKYPAKTWFPLQILMMSHHLFTIKIITKSLCVLFWGFIPLWFKSALFSPSAIITINFFRISPNGLYCFSFFARLKVFNRHLLSLFSGFSLWSECTGQDVCAFPNPGVAVASQGRRVTPETWPACTGPSERDRLSQTQRTWSALWMWKSGDDRHRCTVREGKSPISFALRKESARGNQQWL